MKITHIYGEANIKDFYSIKFFFQTFEITKLRCTDNCLYIFCGMLSRLSMKTIKDSEMWVAYSRIRRSNSSYDFSIGDLQAKD